MIWAAAGVTPVALSDQPVFVSKVSSHVCGLRLYLPVTLFQKQRRLSDAWRTDSDAPVLPQMIHRDHLWRNELHRLGDAAGQAQTHRARWAVSRAENAGRVRAVDNMLPVEHFKPHDRATRTQRTEKLGHYQRRGIAADRLQTELPDGRQRVQIRDIAMG